MAIAKIKGKKLEMTPRAIAELCAAGALAIVAVVFLLAGVNRFRLRRSMNAALEKHDTNHRAPAIEECRSALERDENYHPARQLLAKVLVEEGGSDPGKLAEAEKEYQTLLQKGYDKANAHVGLGVIFLLRADAANDAKPVSDFASKARAAFDAARKADASCMEAEIGLLHVRLLLAVHPATRQGNPADVRGDFDKLRARLESAEAVRSRITREGLLDLYAGLGRALAGEGNSRESARSLRTCLVYAPQWTTPLGNLAYLDAQRIMAEPPARAELENDRNLLSFTALLQNAASVPRADSDFLKEANATREIALSYAYGLSEDFGWLVDKLERAGPTRYDSLSVSAFAWIRSWQRLLERKDVSNRTGRASKAAEAVKALLAHERMKDPKNPERLVALNNAGVLYTDSAVINRAPHHFPPAEKAFQEALAIDKGNYRVNRNMAILQKWTGGAAKPYLDAARAAAGSDDAKRKDLDAIEAWKP
ncbi:MAG: hypothetical protein HYY17_08270 [Planctomycetes bacterium]|nr:hypothetical protein [Planctomycetota bacterium]